MDSPIVCHINRKLMEFSILKIYISIVIYIDTRNGIRYHVPATLSNNISGNVEGVQVDMNLQGGANDSSYDGNNNTNNKEEASDSDEVATNLGARRSVNGDRGDRKQIEPDDAKERTRDLSFAWDVSANMNGNHFLMDSNEDWNQSSVELDNNEIPIGPLAVERRRIMMETTGKIIGINGGSVDVNILCGGLRDERIQFEFLVRRTVRNMNEEACLNEVTFHIFENGWRSNYKGNKILKIINIFDCGCTEILELLSLLGVLKQGGKVFITRRRGNGNWFFEPIRPGRSWGAAGIGYDHDHGPRNLLWVNATYPLTRRDVGNDGLRKIRSLKRGGKFAQETYDPTW